MLDESKKILIVDDDPSIRQSLKLILSRFYSVDTANGSDQALELITIKNVDPNLVLLDVMMPGIGGLGLLDELRELKPGLPIIMLTASNSIQTAVKAMKIGAIDYLSKPYDVDELISLIDEVLRTGAKGRTAPSNFNSQYHLRAVSEKESADFGALSGSSTIMKELYKKIEQLSKTQVSILISGESGTGKELVAREIHKNSLNAGDAFVLVNCSTTTEELLFGVNDQKGLIEQAKSGTLFLDEIGNLSLELQAKILGFLEAKEFNPVDSTKVVKSKARVIASTQYDLESMLDEGRFRKDLFYRVGVVKIELPMLRERVEDIIPSFELFVNSYSKFYGNKELTISKEVAQALQTYPWPGNVRELENLAESLLALSTNTKIDLADLPRRLRETNQNYSVEDEVLAGKIPFEEAEKAFEKQLIIKALEKNNYVQTKAAETLGITRRILKYKMDKLGISFNKK